MPETALVITGLPSASRALNKIYDLVGDMKEGKFICGYLYDNLHSIWEELKSLRKQSALPDTETLERYYSILSESHQYLANYSKKSIVDRLRKREILAKEMGKIIHDVNLLVNILNIQHFCKDMKNWKNDWEIAMVELCTSVDLILDELQTYQSKLEALVIINHELKNHRRDYDARTFGYLNTLRSTIMSNEEITDCDPPSWFIPPVRIKYDKEPFDSGSFGKIHKGEWNHGTEIVVKCLCIDTNMSEKHFYDQIVDEIDLWFSLNHPHITRMYGGSHVSNPPFIICEYASQGNLCRYIKKNQHKMWSMLYEASLGLEYLHQKSIVHGDLKLNNILVGSDGKAKLTDFGMSKIRDSSKLSMLSKEGVYFGGALRWRAPECTSYKPGYASDIYSFAMCIIEAATGFPPFNEDHDHDVTRQVSEGMIPSKPENLSDEAWELVIEMTCLDPSERIKLHEVVVKLKGFADIEKAKHGGDDNFRCISCRVRVEGDVKTCQVCSSLHQLELEIQVDDKGKLVSRRQIKRLIRCLENGDDFEKTKAIETLSNLVLHISNQDIIVAAGGIIPLVELVICGTEEQKAIAAQALRYLTYNNDTNRKLIANAGGIIPLVELVKCGTKEQKTEAAKALCNLACNNTNEKLIADAGGIIPLVKLVECGTEEQKTEAAKALHNLAYNDTNRKLIGNAGGIIPLVELVKCGTVEQKRCAAQALCSLASNNDTNKKLIADADGIIPLVELVKCGTEEQKAEATVALCNLGYNNDTTTKLIADAGGIIPIVELVKCGTKEQKRLAAAAIQNLTANGRNTKLIVDADGIIPLVELVKCDTEDRRAYATGALHNLAHNDTNIKLIVDAGGIIPLVELVKCGTEEQKLKAVAALKRITKIRPIEKLYQT